MSPAGRRFWGEDLVPATLLHHVQIKPAQQCQQYVPVRATHPIDAGHDGLDAPILPLDEEAFWAGINGHVGIGWAQAIGQGRFLL